MKNYKNMKVLLENKLELSGLIKIFKKFLEEILHTKKCDLYKSGFHVLGRQENPCEFPCMEILPSNFKWHRLFK